MLRQLQNCETVETRDESCGKDFCKAAEEISRDLCQEKAQSMR